ncbi:MAG: heavy metal-binding domain-containing protein [Flavobacteriales bacterium]
MKSIIQPAILIAMVLTLGACSDNGNGQGNGHSGTHKADSTGVSTQQYACPMHPEVTGKEGDKCPKCGMALEPVK